MKNFLIFLIFVLAVSCQESGKTGEGNKGNDSVDYLSRIDLETPGPMLPPVPAIVLGVKGDSIKPDALSVAWTFVLEGHPPMVGISVTSNVDEQGTPYYMNEFLKKHKEFTLNVPDKSWVKEFDDIDMSGHKWEDKFEKNKLTRIPSKFIDAPGIAEASIILECRVLQYHELLPNRTVYFAEVLRTTVHKGVVDEKGRLNSQAREYFGMTSGNGEFWTLGEKIGNIGMTKGRDDIKY